MSASLDAAARTAWSKLDQKAKNVIAGFVPEEFFGIIDGKATAREMFQALEAHFSVKSVTQQTHLKREIMQLRLKSNQGQLV